MKRFFLIAVAAALLFPGILSAAGEGKSRSVVYINGTKYYVHTVQAGETLYGISKTYGVSEAVVLQNNPSAADGLKADQTLKIPYTPPLEDAISAKPNRKIRRQFDTHEVRAGETLYSISRRYEISVETIIADNPQADPAGLRIGEQLLIRKKGIGRAGEEQNRAEWEQYKENLNRVAGDRYVYHIVQPGETVYSLSREHGITEAELIALNDLKDGLRAGTIIKLPVRETPPSSHTFSEENSSLPVEANTMIGAAEVPQISFRALRPGSTLQVALLLPLTSDSVAHTSFVEFYQGFLLGLDEVKNRGISVDLTLFNTDRDSSRIAKILQSNEFRRAQLIVGPVYEELIAPVLQYAQREEVPVVSPLADLASTNSDVLFQLAPSSSRKYAKIEDLLASGSHITLIRSEQADAGFEREILPLLASKEYSTFNYRYMQGAENSEANDLSPLLKKYDDNLFIVLAEREIDVDRILASLASAYTNIVARGFTPPRFVVLGNARWNRFNNVDRTTFFKDRVVLLSTYHAKRDSEVIRSFDSRYIRAFGQLPSLYSYRGYDTAVIFCPGMYSDIEYDMEGRTYTPLQTAYSFGQTPGNSTHVNREWMRVNYNNDFTITLE